MERAFVRTAVAAVLAAGRLRPSSRRGVKTEEKTRVQLGGPLGGILSLFGGGKAAKEGIVTTTAVVGERRLIRGGDAGQIVDLAEGAVYDLDLKKKTYTVTSFAELEAALRGGAREGREGSRRRRASSRPRSSRGRTPRRRSSRSTSRSRGPPRSARSPATRPSS